MGKKLSIQGWTHLAPERLALYTRSFSEYVGGVMVSIATAEGERIVHVCDGNARDVRVEDTISCEDLSPANLVEYKFETGDFLVSKVGMDSLEMYRGMKFEAWQKMVLGMWKDCLASFVRLLKVGPICHMFDPMIFPEAPGGEREWQVVDVNGKVRHIPHPVREMRIYNAETKKYTKVDTRLTGAPQDADLDAFWEDLLKEVRETTATQVGPEFIDDCYKLDVDALKKKYI